MLSKLQNPIIEVTTSNINGSEVNSVNSRDIYRHLEVSTKYADWIKRAVEKYDFEESVDFLLLKNEKSNSNNPMVDYVVSLDMAKELCMVSNTKKGKETRKYFIGVEKQANIPLTFEQVMKQALTMADERIAQLENKIIEDKPLTDFGKAISQSTATVKVGDWIKAINDSGDINMGRNKAFKWFRANKYLQKDNMPYQRYVDSGLFEVKEGLVVTDTRQIPTFTTLLTAKGQMFFAKKLKEEVCNEVV